MDGFKNPAASVGIAGPVVSILVLLANQKWPGLGLTDADIGGLIDQVCAVIAAVTGVVGRWRATKQITLTGAPPK